MGVSRCGRQVGPTGGFGEKFLGVVRVALGAPDDRHQRRGFEWNARERGQVLGHRLVAERPHLDRGDAGQPHQFGRNRAQRMAPVQVIGPVRGDDRDPFPVQHPAQERQQVPGGAVGPVHVLEDEQHRRLRGQLREHPEYGAEQLLLRHAGNLAAGLLGGGPVRQEEPEDRAGGDRVHQRRRRLPGGRVAQSVS
jgi:hypothetical protein